MPKTNIRSTTGGYHNPHPYSAQAPPRNFSPVYGPCSNMGIAPPGAAYSNGHPSYMYYGAPTYQRTFHSPHHSSADPPKNKKFSHPSQSEAPPVAKPLNTYPNYSIAYSNQPSLSALQAPTARGAPAEVMAYRQPLSHNGAPPVPYGKSAYSQEYNTPEKGVNQFGHLSTAALPQYHNTYMHPNEWPVSHSSTPLCLYGESAHSHGYNGQENTGYQSGHLSLDALPQYHHHNTRTHPYAMRPPPTYPAQHHRPAGAISSGTLWDPHSGSQSPWDPHSGSQSPWDPHSGMSASVLPTKNRFEPSHGTRGKICVSRQMLQHFILHSFVSVIYVGYNLLISLQHLCCHKYSNKWKLCPTFY